MKAAWLLSAVSGAVLLGASPEDPRDCHSKPGPHRLESCSFRDYPLAIPYDASSPVPSGTPSEGGTYQN